MDRTRRGIFGHGDLDRYSLAEVAALKVSAGLECRKCRKFAALDVDHLTRVHGCQFTLGEVRQLARCQRCRSALPFRADPLSNDPRRPRMVSTSAGSIAMSADE